MPRALSSAFSVKEKWSKELKEVSELEVRNDVQMVKTALFREKPPAFCEAGEEGSWSGKHKTGPEDPALILALPHNAHNHGKLLGYL